MTTPTMIELIDTNASGDRRGVRARPDRGPAAPPWGWC